MIAILFSWVIISFILLSAGNIFIALYNKICKQNEKYNAVETYILGLCFICIPLQFSSLFLPTDFKVLLSYLTICLIYWVFNSNKLLKYFDKFRYKLKKRTFKQIITLIIIILAVAINSLWGSSIFDAANYHQQEIRWFEEYAIVPGLGNLEDRFGFNSNYLLISAIFSFRKLFGEPLYLLQSSLAIFIIIWLTNQIMKSTDKVIGIAMTILSLLFFFLVGRDLADSSTDIIPNLCLFYFILKFTLYPNVLFRNKLFIFIIPLSLVTFKLSVLPLCIFSIFIYFISIKRKQLRIVIFFSAFTLLISGLWLVRNVLISGYLVYPIYEIDFFSPDWKMPEETAKLQRYIIGGYAKFVFSESLVIWTRYRYLIAYAKFIIIENIINLTLFFFTIVTIIYLCFNTLIRKRELYKTWYLLLITLFLYLVYWFTSAPDYRFIYGLMTGLIFLGIVYTQSQNNKPPRSKSSTKLSYIFSICLLILFSKNFFDKYRQNNSLPLDILYHPHSSKMQAHDLKIDTTYVEYKMDENISIKIMNDEKGRSFDILPATGKNGIPFGIFNCGKVQSILTVEPRGKSLQNGFRTNRNFKQLINSSAEYQLNKKYDIR